MSMVEQRDTLVVTTLARKVRTFAADGVGAAAGLAFEQALYSELLEAAAWNHTAGPNELDMGGLLRSRTGMRYEFDGVLLTTDTLYVIEAKRHGHVTRQHISEFVSKLLDVVMGSTSEIGAYAIKPVFVSGLPQIDDAAWRYAISWGILIISAVRPTPWELLTSLDTIPQTDPTKRVIRECELLSRRMWRSLTTILQANSTDSERLTLDANAIYDAQRVADVLEFWRECQRSVERITGALIR